MLDLANVLHAHIVCGEALSVVSRRSARSYFCSAKRCLLSNTCMPSFILGKLVPEVHDAITCAMLDMQLVAEGGVGSKLLNRGLGLLCVSKWIIMDLLLMLWHEFLGFLSEWSWHLLG